MSCKKRETISPDLTPLIDVIFILLIFFIVASTFKKEELALILDLPNSSAKELQVEKKDFTIEVNSNSIAIYGKKVSILDLETKLSQIKDIKRSIIVRIDKDVKYKKVVSIFDILQKYNLSNLTLVTQKD